MRDDSSTLKVLLLIDSGVAMVVSLKKGCCCGVEEEYEGEEE